MPKGKKKAIVEVAGGYQHKFVGWQTFTPGLVCYNRDPAYKPQWPAHKMPWALVHEPSGLYVCDLYKMEECFELAAILGVDEDWTVTPLPGGLELAAARVRAYLTAIAMEHEEEEEVAEAA